MTRITIHADCGGAPKKQLLRDLNIAFAKADVEGILEFFSDDIRWRIMGEADLRGKEAVRAALEAMQEMVASELIIHSIIIQGRAAAVNGLIRTEGGGSVAFCDICQFESADGNKIQSMMSYAVEIKSEG
ncbi:MAG: nuclear transport factor 2 family protein [Chloroflexota bacterium]|nr:nuclear transport factor 2 family protein [Chloroflexota bacterium]MDE2948406.1 nuclear transport factor 2 family protein [Chloroflexota bacterium]